MSMAAEIFEIVPLQHELEYEARFARAPSRAARGPKVSPKPGPGPWPGFRKRRQWRTPSIYGGWAGYPPVYAEPEPAAGVEPTSTPSSEYIRWLQSTLNRALNVSLAVDGVMSASVRSAIRDFQRKNRLPASGYIGPDTESALRRVGGDGQEMEFEWVAELSGEARAADSALSKTRAVPIGVAVKRIGKDVPGLYRFFAPDDRFYTGMTKHLRERIVQHVWCLSHLGISRRNYRVAFCPMKGKSESQIRAIEIEINRYHRNKNPRLLLNVNTELEFYELI